MDCRNIQNVTMPPYIRQMPIDSEMQSKNSTCIIKFDNDSETARAFYELVHSKAQFSGIAKDTFVISKKDCARLTKKHIHYQRLDIPISQRLERIMSENHKLYQKLAESRP